MLNDIGDTDMKIRDGFVSNSSSSSFIIAFDKTPETAKEMKEILFGNKEIYKDPYYSLYGGDIKGWSTLNVAQTVLNGIYDKKSLTPAEVVDAMQSGYIDGEPDPYDYVKETGGIDWDAYNIASKDNAEKLANRFLKGKENKQIYVLEYCDNDGRLDAALEHGGLFEKVDHITISNH